MNEKLIDARLRILEIADRRQPEGSAGTLLTTCNTLYAWVLNGPAEAPQPAETA